MTAEPETEMKRASGPRRVGRPKGSRDSRPRRPDVRLNAVLTAIRAANAAGFDLSVDKFRGIVLTPKAPPVDDKEPEEQENAK